jgi:hypothetical protein
MRQVPKTKKMARFEARYRKQLKLCGFRSHIMAQLRRGVLIDQKIFGDGLTDDESKELLRLQKLVWYYAAWKTNDSSGRMVRRLNRMLKNLGR